jgi:hypothetical protein
MKISKREFSVTRRLKKYPNFGKSGKKSKTVAKPKKCQNICIIIQSGSPKYLHKTPSILLKYRQETMFPPIVTLGL